MPDLQWIEDRFWIWIHYELLKIGHGDYLEAYDFLSYLRLTVFGPLLHMKNRHLPRGIRKVELKLHVSDFEVLQSTIATYSSGSILLAVNNAVKLYRQLREALFDEQKIVFRRSTEDEVCQSLTEIKAR